MVKKERKIRGKQTEKNIFFFLLVACWKHWYHVMLLTFTNGPIKARENQDRLWVFALSYNKLYIFTFLFIYLLLLIYSSIYMQCRYGCSWSCGYGYGCKCNNRFRCRCWSGCTWCGCESYFVNWATSEPSVGGSYILRRSCTTNSSNFLAISLSVFWKVTSEQNFK